MISAADKKKALEAVEALHDRERNLVAIVILADLRALPASNEADSTEIQVWARAPNDMVVQGVLALAVIQSQQLDAIKKLPTTPRGPS